MELTIWFWIGLGIAAIYCLWMVYTWIRGSFVRIFMGQAIIGVKLALEVIGLFIMVAALIFVISNPGNDISPILLQVGLLFAIPAGIYLTIFLITRAFMLDKPFDVSQVNAEWFEKQSADNLERDQKARLLILQLEDRLAIKKKRLLELENQIAQTQGQINNLLKNSSDNEDLIKKLVEEVKTLELQHSDIANQKAKLEEERTELRNERSILSEEQKRLSIDKKRLVQLEQELKSAHADGQAEQIKAYAAELEALKEEQRAKLDQLEIELENARFQLSSAINKELAERESQLFAELDELKSKLGKEITLRSKLEKEKEVNKPYIAKGITYTENQELYNQLDRARKQIEELENQKYQKYLRDKERRAATNAYRREILSPSNVRAHIRKYFVEVAACFMLNREAFKDKFGIGPYNRIVLSEKKGGNERVKHLMTSSVDKLYKFSEKLMDVDRFFLHPTLYKTFEDLARDGTSLVRISEKLHLLYLQNYRKDFVRDYRYKEDFENLLILASHHFLIRHLDFKKMFQDIPLRIKEKLIDNEIIGALANRELVERFRAYLPNYGDLGFENIYQALVVCFVASKQEGMSDQLLADIIITQASKAAQMLEKTVRTQRPAIKKPAASA